MLTAATLGRAAARHPHRRLAAQRRLAPRRSRSIDKWLTAIANDKSDKPLAKKVAATSRPISSTPAIPTEAGRWSARSRRSPTWNAARRCSRSPAMRGWRPAARPPTTCSSARSSRSTARTTRAADRRAARAAEEGLPRRRVRLHQAGRRSRRGLAGTWAVFKGDGEYKFARQGAAERREGRRRILCPPRSARASSRSLMKRMVVSSNTVRDVMRRRAACVSIDCGVCRGRRRVGDGAVRARCRGSPAPIGRTTS